MISGLHSPAYFTDTFASFPVKSPQIPWARGGSGGFGVSAGKILIGIKMILWKSPCL
jgi:hypothetical protein